MKTIRLVSPGKNGQVINEYGLAETPPSGWMFLPAGDAAVTRKVTAKGDVWRVQVKKGRRTISKGIWALEAHITAAKAEVAALRSAPKYEKKKASAVKSRDKKQENYKLEFEQAIATHLNFHPTYKTYETKIAKLVTAHATPIGSGTVARTTMIPVEQRASKAVIAWMRHQTTGYDQMKIARVKGERRNVRRQLAERSVLLLRIYRSGTPIPPDCPLKKALGESFIS